MSDALFNTAPPKTLSSEQMDHFRREGYVIIENLYTQDEIDRMHQLRLQVEKEAEGRTDGYARDGGEYNIEPLVTDPTGRTVALRKIQEVFKSEPSFREVAANVRILDIVEDMIGRPIYYHSSKLMCKPALGGRRKPWHQDFAYWDTMQPKQVTVWGAIDAATRENGCMQVIPRSHLKGLVPHYKGEDFMIDEQRIDESEIVFAEMNPGDVLFFNVLLLHASAPNTSDKPRLATIIDFDSNQRIEGHLYGSDTPLRGA
ncbi:MAG: hypothetical protein CMJ18_23735 [Phycisphaeraceae bacterium]|nr:hypothetical protein [Phycisphaeraceae bacterium]